MYVAFSPRLFPHHTWPDLERLPGLKPQPCHVLRCDGDSGEAMMSPFFDDAADTGPALERRDTEHTSAVGAAIIGVKEGNLRYCRDPFPLLLNFPPVDLEKGNCIRTPTGGDHTGNQGADRSPIWNRWREAYFPEGHVSDSCFGNSLLLPPAVISSPNSSEPSLVVPDGGHGASLTGHAALGEAAQWNGTTLAPMVSPLSTDDCCPAGPSMPGTTSGFSRFASPSSPEPSLMVPHGDKGPSLSGHAMLREGPVQNEGRHDTIVSPPSSDDSVPPRASVPGTMPGTIRGSSHGSPEPSLVVPDGDTGTPLTGHAALGEGAMLNETTCDLRVRPASSDDCVPPGATMPGTMSGTISTLQRKLDKPQHGRASEAVG